MQAKCSPKWNTGAAWRHTKWNQEIQEVNCRYWIWKCHPGCLFTDQCFQTWAFLLTAFFFKSSLNLRQPVPWRSPAYPSGTNLILVLFKSTILHSFLFHLLYMQKTTSDTELLHGCKKGVRTPFSPAFHWLLQLNWGGIFKRTKISTKHTV